LRLATHSAPNRKKFSSDLAVADAESLDPPLLAERYGYEVAGAHA
jgi:hypothetical protein